MGKLARLRQTTPLERRLLLRAWLLLWAMRLSLWLCPFAASRKFAAWAGRPRSGSRHQPLPPERLAWAVRVTARFVPGASCLTQALTTQTLLSRHGYPSRLRFGVLRDRRRGLAAHAWVESDGVTVIGGGNLGRYVELISPTESPPELSRTSDAGGGGRS